MGTRFSEIYERAAFRFSDYSFMALDYETRGKVLRMYLFSAIADFQNSCKSDLSKYDLTSEAFENELNDEIQEILALCVAFYWLSAKTLSSDLFKNVLHNKDYTTYSSANLLIEMHALRSTLKSEFYSKIRLYSIRHNEFDW